MSVLARLNPLTPLALITALGIGVSFLFAPLPTLALHLSVVTLLLAAGAGLRGVVISHLTFTPFAVGVLATNAVSRPGAVLAHAGPLMITDEGVAVGMALALRVLVVAVPAVAVASVLDPTRLVTAAMQHLRLTPSVGFAVLTAHRMLGAMPQQWSTLLAAGLDAATAAAIVISAGSPQMRVLRAPVSRIAAVAADAGVEPPAITVIGAVAELELGS